MNKPFYRCTSDWHPKRFKYKL